MKKLALMFVMTLFLTACSSGNTVSDEPINLTGNYFGEFENQEGNDEGTVILDLVEDTDGNFSGIAQFIDSGCLLNGTVTSGFTSGFNVSLVIDQEGGSITLQLVSDNAGNLNGTYITSGETCSNESGTGSISLSLS